MGSISSRSLTLRTRQGVRKGGSSGTSYCRPLASCQPGETWYPKPVAAIHVPAGPLLPLSGTLNQVHSLVECRGKQLAAPRCSGPITVPRLSKPKAGLFCLSPCRNSWSNYYRNPVFGHLIHHYGLRRVNVRGQAGAHKTMVLAAVAYNLKKLLKYRPQRQVSQAMALPRPILAANARACQRNKGTQASTQVLTRRLPRNKTTSPEFCNSPGGKGKRACLSTRIVRGAATTGARLALLLRVG